MTTTAQPQHLEALDRANRIRSERAATKRQILEGEMTVTEALALDCCQTMKLGNLLTAQHMWGKGRTARFLAPLELTTWKQVSTLTERQRNLVTDALKEGS